MRNPSFSGGEFLNFSSSKNLIISEGMLGEYPRRVFMDFINKKNNMRNISANSEKGRPLIEFIDYNQDSFFGKEASRILYLSNSSSIISHLKALKSNVNQTNSMLYSQYNNIDFQDQIDLDNPNLGSANFFDSLIENYIKE